MKNIQKKLIFLAQCLLLISCVGNEVVDSKAAERDQESRIRESIKDAKDEFENTRVIELRVYDRMREALDIMVREPLRKGNLEAASAGSTVLGLAPMTPLVLISFVEYTKDDQPFYFIKLFFSVTEGFFNLETAKISVDGQIIEFLVIEKISEKITEAKDKTKYYKQEYMAATDYETFQRVDASQIVKFKFYGSNDRTMLVEFDAVDKKYVKAFVGYIKK